MTQAIINVVANGTHATKFTAKRDLMLQYAGTWDSASVVLEAQNDKDSAYHPIAAAVTADGFAFYVFPRGINVKLQLVTTSIVTAADIDFVFITERLHIQP